MHTQRIVWCNVSNHMQMRQNAYRLRTSCCCCCSKGKKRKKRINDEKKKKEKKNGHCIVHSASSTNAIGLAGYFQRPPLSVDNIEQSHPPHLIPIPVPTLEHKKSQGRNLSYKSFQYSRGFSSPKATIVSRVRISFFYWKKRVLHLLLSLLVGQL